MSHTPSVRHHAVESSRRVHQKRPTTRCGHVVVTFDRFILVWGGYWVDMQGELDNRERYLPPEELWIFDTDTDTWSRRKAGSYEYEEPRPDGRSGATAALIPDMSHQLHIFGGYNENGDLNDMWSLDLQKLRWWEHNYILRETKAQPSPRDKHNMWGYKGKLYVFGGYGPPIHAYLHDNGNFYLDSNYSFIGLLRGWNDQLLVYDEATDIWSNPSGSGCGPNARAAMTSAQLNEKIFLFGGRHADKRLNDLYTLNLDSLVWAKIEVLDNIPCGRTWSTLTPISDTELFLYGGFTQSQVPLSDGWIFDTVNRTWCQQRLPNTNPRLWHSAACTKTKDTLIFGGCANNILDHVNYHEHADTMLEIRFAPRTLVKSCLETVSIHRTRILKSGWEKELPKSLSENLRTRLKFLVSEPTESLCGNGNSVCSVS